MRMIPGDSTNNEFDIIPYSISRKKEWDDFVASSKNATFILSRDYMDYHADRFADSSLIFYRKGKIYALLPASRSGDKICSHAGLTYGGLVMSAGSTVADILHITELFINHFRREGIRQIIYKPIPHIYHTLPAEEDLYALFRNGATLTARNVASVISNERRVKFRNIRKSGIRKALRAGVSVSETSDFKTFWNLLSANLNDKYGASPVHSADEIEMLANKFPSNIRLFGAFNDGEMIAGTVIYATPSVAHCQYISASPEGKSSGALDLIFDHLINTVFSDIMYFDFGTSNENGGMILNESLIYQKEGFGARAICYDTYLINLSDHK